MKKISEKMFVGVVANIVIAVLIVSVFMIGFAGKIEGTFVFEQMVKPYYQGKTESKDVSIMINVYWGNEYILSMLETLKKANVKATFFIGGMWAEKYPQLLKSIYESGNEIANHGYFHKSQDKMNYKQNYEEIRASERMIQSVVGIKTNLFAPPSGAFNKETLKAAEDLGYKTIMWSKDTIDWRDKDAELIFNRATKKIKGGDLILMHPTEATDKALSRILNYFKINGFNVTIVSKNIE
ncbi:MAG: polysaccharide deacetylase family protein [Clostridia bacterium]